MRQPLPWIFCVCSCTSIYLKVSDIHLWNTYWRLYLTFCLMAPLWKCTFRSWYRVSNIENIINVFNHSLQKALNKNSFFYSGRYLFFDFCPSPMLQSNSTARKQKSMFGDRSTFRFERLKIDCNDHLWIYDGAHDTGQARVGSIWTLLHALILFFILKPPWI